MVNPITQARQKLGLSRPDLARGARIRYDDAYKTEAGLVRIPHHAIVEFLVAAGFERQDLLNRYAAYRQALAEDVRRRAVTR